MLTTINFPHVVEYVMHSGARHVPALRCLNCLDFLHLFTIRPRQSISVLYSALVMLVDWQVAGGGGASRKT